jgi:hypothetical protein
LLLSGVDASLGDLVETLYVFFPPGNGHISRYEGLARQPEALPDLVISEAVDFFFHDLAEVFLSIYDLYATGTA